ncbi:hypothetical protein NM688_g776 [Phlebia brevispora]|uniref:Uncharacterized protein n=1 Tax=Phlebia brevispora TaxID=194682 RepID=A0ACC1TD65_9APHY|nr:hypothetical protein NM688_g776 [Phlebia brevispora]
MLRWGSIGSNSQTIGVSFIIPRSRQLILQASAGGQTAASIDPELVRELQSDSRELRFKTGGAHTACILHLVCECYLPDISTDNAPTDYQELYNQAQRRIEPPREDCDAADLGAEHVGELQSISAALYRTAGFPQSGDNLAGLAQSTRILRPSTNPSSVWLRSLHGRAALRPSLMPNMSGSCSASALRGIHDPDNHKSSVKRQQLYKAIAEHGSSRIVDEDQQLKDTRIFESSFRGKIALQPSLMLNMSRNSSGSALLHRTAATPQSGSRIAAEHANARIVNALVVPVYAISNQAVCKEFPREERLRASLDAEHIGGCSASCYAPPFGPALTSTRLRFPTIPHAAPPPHVRSASESPSTRVVGIVLIMVLSLHVFYCSLPCSHGHFHCSTSGLRIPRSAFRIADLVSFRISILSSVFS